MDIRKLDKIIQNYRSNKLYGQEFPKAILNFYTKSARTIEVQNKILSLVDSEYPRTRDWPVVFQSEIEMSRKIDLALTNSIAKKLYGENITDELIMKNVASHAYNNCTNTCIHKKSGFFDIEKEKIWIDIFQESPQFKVHFDKIRIHIESVNKIEKKLKM